MQAVNAQVSQHGPKIATVIGFLSLLFVILSIAVDEYSVIYDEIETGGVTTTSLAQYGGGEVRAEITVSNGGSTFSGTQTYDEQIEDLEDSVQALKDADAPQDDIDDAEEGLAVAEGVATIAGFIVFFQIILISLQFIAFIFTVLLSFASDKLPIGPLSSDICEKGGLLSAGISGILAIFMFFFWLFAGQSPLNTYLDEVANADLVWLGASSWLLFFAGLFSLFWAYVFMNAFGNNASSGAPPAQKTEQEFAGASV